MKLRKHLRDMMPILAFTLLNPIQVSTAWAEDLPVAISTPSEKLIHPKSERKSAPHSSPKLKVNVVPKSLQIVWSEGSVADALHFAKANQKPVFIYWGAEWCPPCNQLKAEVFSNREFIEATAPMTMVMIDGDSPEAQRWSDHFNVSGYPTLLFLDNDGNQKARFVGFTPADILISTIKSLRSTTTAIKDLAGKIARSEKLSPDEWKIIAFSDWTKYSESNFGGKHPIDAALAALDQIPAELHNEKALISIFIMSSGPEAPDAQGKIINQSFDKLLSMLSPAELVTASTLDFFSWGGPTLKWFISDNVSVEAQRKRVQNWTKTLEKITTRANGSLSQRLDIAAARASIMPLQPISAESTIKQTKELDDLRKEIEKLRDQHQLTSMLPKLADSYASVGDGAKAIALLERAAAKSAVPYYFYGHIASLLEQAGEPEKSVVMRERAMRAARGTATKIQWTWNYLKSAEKSGLMDKDRRVETAAIELVKRNIEAKDGFLGRNRRYLDKASEVINRIPKKTKKLVLALEGYQKDCLSFQDPDRLAGCRSFFEKLSLKDAPPVPAESIK